MQTEHVILLNAQGVPTGTLEKYAAHTADTLLHLAFSSWLFNAKGQLLVTRRALSKKAWPGVWTVMQAANSEARKFLSAFAQHN